MYHRSICVIWPGPHLRFHLSSHWQGMTLPLITVQATNLAGCLQVFEQTASLRLEHHFPICFWNSSFIKSFLTGPSRTNHSVSLCTVHGFYSWHSHRFTALNSHASSSSLDNVNLTPQKCGPLLALQAWHLPQDLGHCTCPPMTVWINTLMCLSILMPWMSGIHYRGRLLKTRKAGGIIF